MEGHQIIDFSPLLLSLKYENESITAFQLAGTKGLAFGTSHGRCVFKKQDEMVFMDFPKMDGYIGSISIDQSNKIIIYIAINESKTKTSNFQIVSVKNFSVLNKGEYENKILYCSICPSYIYNHSFVFADNQGNIMKCTKNTVAKYLFGPGNSFLCLSKKNKYIFQVLWLPGYILWISISTIRVIRDNNEKEYLFDIKIPQKIKCQKAGFVFLEAPNKIGAHYGQLFYLIGLNRNHEIVVNTHNNIIAMAVNGETTIQIYKNDDEKILFFIDHQNNTHIYEPFMNGNFINDDILFFSKYNNGFILVLTQNTYVISVKSEIKELEFLMENNNPIKCLEEFNKIASSLGDDEKFEFAQKVIGMLLLDNKTVEAVNLCKKHVLNINNNVDKWEKIIFIFDSHNHLAELLKLIPSYVIKYSESRIKIILEILNTNAPMFCQLFCDLPREYFDNDVIVDGLKKKSVVVLIYCIPLIYIYLFRNEYKEALDASIKINYQNIFRDIEQSFSHHEYSELICEAIYDHFSELCSTYEDIFTEFLILHYQTLNPKQILYYFQSSLKNTDQKMESCLLRYITKLYEERKDVIDHFDKNYRIDFATKYAKLLLKFRCSNTLDFIQNNQDFDGQVIQQIALQEKMYKELAFLSAKNGAAIYGLNVYINHIKSWNEAIYYAIQVNQEESYSLLIQESYHNKELLKCMIENLPMLQIDQEKFLREIPENEWCDEYSLLAQKALKEFQVRLSINKNILEIISKSSFHLFSNQINKSKRGHISKNNM